MEEEEKEDMGPGDTDSRFYLKSIFMKQLQKQDLMSLSNRLHTNTYIQFVVMHSTDSDLIKHNDKLAMHGKKTLIGSYTSPY